MKKSILALCFLFVATVSNNVFGQSRIGWTLDQISKDFTKEKYPIQRISNNRHGGGFYMFVYSSIGDAIFFTNEDSLCTRCVFIPSSDSSFNVFVKMYNANSRTVNNNSWIHYNEKTGSIISIDIIKDDLEGYNSNCGSYFEFKPLN